MIVYVPAGLVGAVLIVIVDVEAVGLGLNEKTAPLGRPLAPSETRPVKPPLGITETVYETAPPRATLWLDGDAESEKSGAEPAWTTSVTAVEWTRLPTRPQLVSTDESNDRPSLNPVM